MKRSLKLFDLAASSSYKSAPGTSCSVAAGQRSVQAAGERWMSSKGSSGKLYTQQTRAVSLGSSSANQVVQATAPQLAMATHQRLLETELGTMFKEINQELEKEISHHSELKEMATYYFDGKGKAIRPVIALCVGHAYNVHMGRENDEELKRKQRLIAIISEMIHTASLVHDDILDHAETRRGKKSVNLAWDPLRSTFCGDYIIAVSSKLLSTTGNEDVIELLSRVLSDLVQGELQQLQNKTEEGERFEEYISKSYNKTASLMANSCQANAVLAGATKAECENAFLYGKHLGIGFQLVDDLLDFVSSADQLGKPAAADLELGLATAPVLFATKQFPELETMINRRFSKPGDVARAFECAIQSGGVEETRKLARNHCNEAMDSVAAIKDSTYKQTLAHLCETVLNRIN